MTWNEVTFGDLVTLKQGFALNSKSKHYLSDEENGMPLLKISDLLNNTETLFVKKEIPKQFLVFEDEIIYSRTGQVGYAFMDKKGVIYNNCFKVIPNEEKINKIFLYKILNTEIIRNYAQTLATGTAQLDLNHDAFKSIKIKLPPLEIQQKIVNLISNYDDLIENNNKRIRLLENMAEELYKEWFVRLRFPNYQNIKIEDGIPQGWKEKTINKLCEVTSSKRIFSSEYIEKGIPFFRVKSNNKSIDDILYIKQEKYEEIKKSFGIPKEKDILLTAVGTIGSIYSVKKSDDEFYFKDGNLIWLKNFNNEVEYFIYYFMKSEEIQNKLNNISIGSSQKALTIDSIKK